MNRYRVVSAPEGWPEDLPFRVSVTDGDYGVGDEFDHEFTEDEELANTKSGLVEIVPREYKVLQGQVADTDTDGTFKAAFTIGQEAHLVGAGFIERVEQEPAPDGPTPRQRKKVKT